MLGGFFGQLGKSVSQVPNGGNTIPHDCGCVLMRTVYMLAASLNQPGTTRATWEMRPPSLPPAIYFSSIATLWNYFPPLKTLLESLFQAVTGSNYSDFLFFPGPTIPLLIHDCSSFTMKSKSLVSFNTLVGNCEIFAGKHNCMPRILDPSPYHSTSITALLRPLQLLAACSIKKKKKRNKKTSKNVSTV